MNSKALLTILAFVAWALFCNWWWCGHQATCSCNDGSSTAIVDETSSAATSDGIIRFNANDFNAVQGANWGTTRDSLLNLVRSGKRIEITGYYGSSETNSTQFENLGLARADALRQLFVSAAPELSGRYSMRGEVRNDLPGTTPPFEASSFAVKDTIAAPKAEGGVVATDSNDILIYFPSGSSSKKQSQEVDDFLVKLAGRLKASGEKANVIGHTDNKGKYESNLKLSQDRAALVKSILVRNAAIEGNITPEGKADKEPVGDNNTDAGRALNRRVQIKISK
jgi:OmpA-OmpF porin, OOP family